MKRIALIMAAALAALSLTGCSKESLDNISTFVEAGGRDYGDTITSEIGESQKNTFFSTTVNKVEFAQEIGDYYVDEGYEFVLIDTTVINCFSQNIPMGNTDFYIKWGEGEDDWDGPCGDYIAENAYKDEFTLAVGEDYNGVLYFIAPTERSDKLQLVYEELYEDDFVGSKYIINLE